MKTLKESCKFAINILLFVNFIVLILAVWLDLNILAIMAITLGALSIGVSMMAAEEFKFKIIVKDLNIYFFLVAIIIGISVIMVESWLLYIGLALFFLVLLFYAITILFDDKNAKETKKQTNEGVASNKTDNAINKKIENQNTEKKPNNNQQNNKKNNNIKKKKK